jgi:hypothetical protein
MIVIARVGGYGSWKTNQEDLAIFPRVEIYPLQYLGRNVKESTITNNHHVYRCILHFSWYGHIDDVWMRCPLREPDSVHLNKHRGRAIHR